MSARLFTRLLLLSICIFCRSNTCECNELVFDHVDQSDDSTLSPTSHDQSLPSSSFSSYDYPIPAIHSQSHSLLPNCDTKSTKHDKIAPKDLFLISTLDGKIQALDDDGKLKWTHVTDPGSLLSSTISNFELSKKGHLVKIVPSLDGNLYLYNGQTIESVPLNADSLLKSSYKLGDDLVISGFMESKIYGLNIQTGEIYYECGREACPQSDNETNEVLLVKRITQTVRANEPRNGREKWHFSVGEAQLTYTLNHDECHAQENENANVISDDKDRRRLKVTVPEGLITARIDGESDDAHLWKHKFDSPIVKIWHFKDGRLSPMDLFDPEKLNGFESLLKQFEKTDSRYSPTIYIGLHEKQWYVQHSEKVKNEAIDTVGGELIVSEADFASKYSVMQIEWKPETEKDKYGKETNSSKQVLGKEEVSVTSSGPLVRRPSFSLQVLSYNNIANTGYYLIENECQINQSKKFVSFHEEDNEKEDDEEDGNMPQIIIASIWYYWREILAISLVSSVSFNWLWCCIMSLFKKPKKEEDKSKTEIATSESSSSSKPSGSITISLTPSTPLSSLSYNGENTYTSRFLDDFEPIRTLGKGGFGVVFEAKHRIDEGHYAIKRINLPGKKEQRDKVLREVKALSTLEHVGIVRYYYAWKELPPPGWQEDKDKEWDFSEVSALSYHYSHNLKSTTKESFIKEETEFTKFSTIESSANFKPYDSKDFNLIKDNVFVDYEETSSYIAFVDSGCDRNNDEDDNEENVNIKMNEEVKASDTVRPKSISSEPTQIFLYIQMQLCRKDTLREWLLNNPRQRDIKFVYDIFDQIISAVEYVHSTGLMHRDLKPSNIFFSMDGVIKIGDFGLVTAISENEVRTPSHAGSGDKKLTDCHKHTDRVGTQLYMSPEQMNPGLGSYSNKVDIFSMGIIFFELLVPFKTEMERHRVLNDIRRHAFPEDFQLKFPRECSLVRQLLAPKPDDRPSAKEIKENALFKDLQPISEVVEQARRSRSRTISQSVSID